MRNSQIEALIPKAIKYIEEKKSKFNHEDHEDHEQKDGIDKVYSGYLNAFGPTITTAGLIRTVAFYEGDKKKQKIVEMIFVLLKQNKDIQTEAKNLLEFISENENYKNLTVKNKIISATIACKLAIKTFKLEE